MKEEEGENTLRRKRGLFRVIMNGRKKTEKPKQPKNMIGHL